MLAAAMLSWRKRRKGRQFGNAFIHNGKVGYQAQVSVSMVDGEQRLQDFEGQG